MNKMLPEEKRSLRGKGSLGEKRLVDNIKKTVLFVVWERDSSQNRCEETV